MLPGSSAPLPSALPSSTLPGTYAPSGTLRVATCQARSCLRPLHCCPFPRVCLLSRLPWPSANATSSRKLALTMELAQTLPKVTLPLQSLFVSLSWNGLSVYCRHRLAAVLPPLPTTEPPGPLWLGPRFPAQSPAQVGRSPELPGPAANLPRCLRKALQSSAWPSARWQCLPPPQHNITEQDETPIGEPGTQLSWREAAWSCHSWGSRGAVSSDLERQV